MKTVKWAKVLLDNGYTISLLTMTPFTLPGSDWPMFIVYGDERIPTYEVGILDPDGEFVRDPLARRTAEEVEQIIEEYNKKPPKRYDA
jgi:hypothetical protein